MTPPPRPDQPAVPVPRPSWLVRAWTVVLALAVALYAVATVMAWGGHGTTEEEVPPSVRASPGGYRSFHFWHSGYQGGK